MSQAPKQAKQAAETIVVGSGKVREVGEIISVDGIPEVGRVLREALGSEFFAQEVVQEVLASNPAKTKADAARPFYYRVRLINGYTLDEIVAAHKTRKQVEKQGGPEGPEKFVAASSRPRKVEEEFYYEFGPGSGYSSRRWPSQVVSEASAEEYFAQPHIQRYMKSSGQNPSDCPYEYFYHAVHAPGAEGARS